MKKTFKPSFSHTVVAAATTAIAAATIVAAANDRRYSGGNRQLLQLATAATVGKNGKERIILKKEKINKIY